MRPRTEGWRARRQQGAAAAYRSTGRRLDALARGEDAHLRDARVQAEQPSALGRFGMCGHLDVCPG